MLKVPFFVSSVLFLFTPNQESHSCSTSKCVIKKHSIVEENKTFLEDIEEEIEEIQTIQENDNDNEIDDNQVGCPKCCCTFLDEEEFDHH